MTLRIPPQSPFVRARILAYYTDMAAYAGIEAPERVAVMSPLTEGGYPQVYVRYPNGGNKLVTEAEVRRIVNADGRATMADFKKTSTAIVFHYCMWCGGEFDDEGERDAHEQVCGR